MDTQAQVALTDTSRRALLGVFVLSSFLPSRGLAMWTAMSDAELVQGSPLIVLGSWVGEGLLTLPGLATPVQVGTIAISETLKGAVGQSVVYVAVPQPSGLRSSTDIHYRKGDTGLWLLRPHPGAAVGLYLADNPQRFVPAATGAARIDTLRRAIIAR